MATEHWVAIKLMALGMWSYSMVVKEVEVEALSVTCALEWAMGVEMGNVKWETALSFLLMFVHTVRITEGLECVDKLGWLMPSFSST